MVYVWQHFSAIEIGYQVETQKQQVEQMREQNRQLRLTEAQLSDPGAHRPDRPRAARPGRARAGPGGAPRWGWRQCSCAGAGVSADTALVAGSVVSFGFLDMRTENSTQLNFLIHEQTSRHGTHPLTAPIRRMRFAWVAIFFCVWVGSSAAAGVAAGDPAFGVDGQGGTPAAAARSRWRLSGACCTTATCASWR
jgi:hypothetical protein